LKQPFDGTSKKSGEKNWEKKLRNKMSKSKFGSKNLRSDLGDKIF